ncbi:ABC transporter substrate-binding protein [Moraxella nasovis]|uniref:ABC transporter substrate-binding protein n=1 Tax=Moraxella nasovis TaxID=2904121 RepID=UPI001F61A995|nr:ABC transporter substrate-binding protein [Moraxella nasovis]UNU73676.1 ABC transporter substrate-binding protein [Moraxella nasovis]
MQAIKPVAIALSVAALFGCSQDKPQATEQTAQEPVTQPSQEPKTIAISAIVEHPSLNDIRKGLIYGLGELGYKDGQNLTVNFQSAQGNMATAGQIAKQFAADNPDVIVAITTPTAQTVAAVTQSIPLVYTAVSDPVAAKLLDEDGKPTQPNVTGLSSELPLAPQIDMIKKVVPNAKRIGFVYSPGEANSVSIRDRLLVELPKRGMELVDVPANRSADVADAARALAGKVDLFYTSLDNGVASAMEALVGAANEQKVPVLTSDEFSVRRGATAALGVNDFDFGVVTAKLVADVLNGKSPSEVAPSKMNTMTFYISPKHAKTQGVQVTDALLKDAINVDTTPPKE